ARIALLGHSGGGSFITGYINGGPEIPGNLETIAYLDANYSYSDEEHHGDKLLAWLKGDTTRRLIVIAVDDRDGLDNGKKIVRDTGGTYRSTHRMLDRFSKDMKVADVSAEPFERFTADDGRIRVYIHKNPEKKILHTILVEKNGFLEAM